jgi:8-oxo-dGTP diphosphatase
MARSHHSRDYGAMPVHVVAAALIRDGRVLAARRSRPAPVVGGWEFPGGKVEPGESEQDALIREITEELGAHIEVGERLGETSDEHIRLILFAGHLLRGEPAPGVDHDEIRWLAADELGALAWLPIDRDLLPRVLPHLRD